MGESRKGCIPKLKETLDGALGIFLVPLGEEENHDV
jgi:hypothetical protein